VLRRIRKWSRRVIAIDAPGHGLSDRPTVWDPERLHQATHEALSQVLDEPVVVYGNSMGGFAAVRFAQAQPQQVLALALTSPGGAPMTANELADFVGRFAFARAADALLFLDRLYGKRRFISRWIASGVRTQMMRVQPILDCLEPKHMLTRDELAGLSMPILLQWGPLDRLLPQSHQAFFREHLPNHVFEAPPTFGHSPNLDRPAELAHRLQNFVSSLESRE
jgi:pimeloyl-ACP methyl ester carboxylesterase